MKKRILMLATVAALMALMLVAMASAALAVADGPPAGGDPGCDGGTNNANHAVQQSSPSYDATFDNENLDHHPPSQVGDDNRNSEPPGEDKATDTEPIGSGGNCRNN